MADLSKSQRRMNRKYVLDALKSETRSSGGDASAARVDAHRADPNGADTVEFACVGTSRWCVSTSTQPSPTTANAAPHSRIEGTI